jgi:hypothetical protein
MRLTTEEVGFFMKNHRRTFESSPTQIARRWHDKYDLKYSARQVSQRQDSRFNGLIKHNFGGIKCLQAYLQDGTYGPRMLPPLVSQPPRDEEVKRYANKRNPKQQKQSKRKYYENLVQDLTDPTSEEAQKRTSRRFAQIQKAMEDARQGRRWFYVPPRTPQEEEAGQGSAGISAAGPTSAKGSSKGKGTKSVEQRMHWNLLQAGLVVCNPMPPPPPLQEGTGWHTWESWQCWHCGGGSSGRGYSWQGHDWQGSSSSWRSGCGGGK